MTHIPYRPRGKFLWDFWIYEEGGTYHLFHLQAPVSPDPRTRHRRSSIGHAVSTDLIHWREVGTALTASDDETAWDSVSLWTGCTVKKDDTYYMFYTARAQSDVAADGYIGHTQRIGVALSKDLYSWEKYAGNPVLTADGRFYEKQPDAYNRHEGWRDPFIVHDRQNNVYYAFMTARDKHGDPQARGCIARARSSDLLNWDVLPPAVSPHTFTDMEVPSLHWHNGKWYLLFSVLEEWYSEQYRQAIAPRQAQTGVLYYTADSLDGEFTPLDDGGVLLGTTHNLYTGRVVKEPKGGDVLLSWYLGAAEGRPDVAHPYALSRPIPISYDEDGKMFLIR